VLVTDPGENLSLPLLIAHPDAEQQPVYVAIQIDDRSVTNFICNTPAWQKIMLPRPTNNNENQNTKACSVVISVDRTWRPKDFGAIDTRELGAAIGKIEKVREREAYDEEQ
jgi:hypothetical protein